jgi:hypothetical protein
VKYLRNESKPQFFNALTIALLPKNGNSFAPDYVQHNDLPPLDDPDLEEPIQVGDIQIQAYKDSDGLVGKMRWNRKQTIAVAVDGQHRLAALKRLSGLVSAEKLDKSLVTVILLIPSPKVGYSEPPQPKGHGKSVVHSLRRIFIDLNKHAKPVTRSRNILLDDQDIVSVCIRSVIGKKLSEETEKNRVPLALVDWISEKNKFESGPFFTTILILYDIIDQALERPNTKEPEEEDDNKIRQWLRNVFGTNETQTDEIMSQVNRCYLQEVPLTFLPSDIVVLADCFKQRWRKIIFRFFHEIKPYKALWDFGVENNLHKPEFVNLYITQSILSGNYAKDRAEEIKNNNKIYDPTWNEKKHYTDPMNYIDTEIKSNNWAFKVVFQKALFEAFFSLTTQASDFVDDYPSEEVLMDKFTNMWIESINALFEAGLGITNFTFSIPKEKFWVGIALKGDDTIEYTKAGVERISRWLRAWVCMYWIGENIPQYCDLPGCGNKLAKMCHRSLDTRSVKSGMEKIVKARDPELELEDITEEGAKLLEKRYSLFRKLIIKMAEE